MSTTNGSGQNYTLCDPNPRRRYLRIASSSNAAVYLSNQVMTAIQQGISITVGSTNISAYLELYYEDVGQLVCGPIYVYGLGTSGGVSVIEGIACDGE